MFQGGNFNELLFWLILILKGKWDEKLLIIFYYGIFYAHCYWTIADEEGMDNCSENTFKAIKPSFQTSMMWILVCNV